MRLAALTVAELLTCSLQTADMQTAAHVLRPMQSAIFSC